jgi:hypothetical protein
MAATMDAAMIRFHSPPYWLWNVAMPTWTTQRLSDFATVSGQRKLFHVARNVSTLSAASIGLLSGSTIDTNRRR